MIVSKFGGSSLSNASQFEKVKTIVLNNSERKVVVVSAPGKSREEKHKVTDLLLMCYQLASHKLNFDEVFGIIKKRFKNIVKDLNIKLDIDKELEIIHREIIGGASREFIASRGEYLNAKILANFLDFDFLDAKDIIFIENEKANMEKSFKAINSKIDLEKHYVVPGFYGSGIDSKIKTFSRGGSDISGAIIAAALDAELYENWTDVSGFLTADPKIVLEEQTIKTVTYRELRELSYMGAPVLHEEAIFPVKAEQIPIKILNTNRPQDSGTLILPDESVNCSDNIITGISGKKDFTVIRIEKVFMAEDLSFYRKVLSVFETNDIKIEHMPTSIDTVSFVVASSEIEGKEKKISEEIAIYTSPDNIFISKGLAIIAVVGRGMVSAKGTSAIIFTALAENNINIRMISQGSSEMNIIIGVLNEDFEAAIEAIYKKFKELKK
ncbi:MAG: aspartate kinase [Tissierellia bacterium]|nr:aspartate kinase [Tissierellia bacterium]